MISIELIRPNDVRKRDIEPADRSELQVSLSGVTGQQVLHATGPLVEAGAQLIVALVEQSVDRGCAYLILDLSGVTTIHTASLDVLRQFQAKMGAIGVTLTFTDPHRRTPQVGLTYFQVSHPAVSA